MGFDPTNAANLATLKTELNTDPLALGYAAKLALGDDTSLAAIIDFPRDGVTPCPVNNTIGNVSKAITGATNATPIQITSTGHGLSSNQGVVITGVLGNTAANGTWIVTVVDANHYTLNTSVGNGVYTSGGQWVPAVRNPQVAQSDIVGAIQVGDLITAGGGTAVTADQFGKIQLFGFLVNEPSGVVALTNSDGSDNNNLKNLRNAFAANSASRTAINALAYRIGSRAEQLFGAGTVLGASDIGAAVNS